MYGGPAASSSMLGEDKEAFLLGKKRVDKLIESAPNVEQVR